MKKLMGVLMLVLFFGIFIYNLIALMTDLPMSGGVAGLVIPWVFIFPILFMMKDSPSKNSTRNQKLDRQLQAYFSAHDTLTVNDRLTVRKPVSEGVLFNNLIVLYNDEVIGKMSEFNQYYPDTYRIFSHRLASLTAIEPTIKKPVPEPVMQETEPTPQSKSFIEQIDEYNIIITDEKLSEALYGTTAMLKHLDLLLQKYPKDNHKLDRLYEHYLPILLDILKNYVTVTNAHADKDEISRIHEKLMKTIILINEAIKNITTSLFEEEMMNLSADMTVLENILKRDGLVSDELDIDQLGKLLKEQEEAYVKAEK